jgi:hypothetical protein
LNLDASSLDEAFSLDNLLVEDIIKREHDDDEVVVEDVRDRQKKDNHNMSMIFIYFSKFLLSLWQPLLI